MSKLYFRAWLTACLCAATQISMAASLPGKFAPYVDKNSGLSFEYPADATVTPNADKDNVVKFEGTTNGVGYTFSLQNTDPALGPDPISAAKFLSQYALPKMPNAHAFHTESVWVGNSRSVGVSTTASFDAGPTRAKIKIVTFKDPKDPTRVRVMAFSAAEKDFGKTEPLVAHILQSIGTAKKTVATTSNTSASPRVSDSTYASPDLSFDYPKGWEVHEWNGKEVEIKSTGNSAGGGSLHLGMFPANAGYTAEQVAAMIETEHLAKLKDYKKQLESTQTCGRKHDVTGLRHSYSATAEDFPASIQVFVFQHNNNWYCLSLTLIGSDPTQSLKQFDSVLSSISLK